MAVQEVPLATVALIYTCIIDFEYQTMSTRELLATVLKSSSSAIRQGHIDMSDLDELLHVEDHSNVNMMMWVAKRNHSEDLREDSDDEDSIGDDNSVDVLAHAVSRFFEKLFSCGCLPSPD